MQISLTKQSLTGESDVMLPKKDIAQLKTTIQSN